MRKYLPHILIGAGILLVAIVGFVIYKGMNGKGEEVAEEESIPELPQEQWPAVSLSPTNKSDVVGSDGHWLNLRVQKINVPGAASMDYLLVYSTADGGQQGVPGTVKLVGGDIERKLLLGSESSGKFRYDAGVETGSITIIFRNEKGKSMGKLASEFHLQSGVTTLTSTDGKFTYELDKLAKGVFFVTMPTFIEPSAMPEIVVWKDGYGVFSSDKLPHSGK